MIARNSSFTYKGKPVKVQEVAEQLGVRYVLEGSVQREGDKHRVTAQLIDATTGIHLWSKRYDRELTDLFDLQDDISQEILVELRLNLTRVGARTAWEDLGDLESYRLFLNAVAIAETISPAGNREAAKLFAELLERKPDSTSANLMMGWNLWQKLILGLSEDPVKTMALSRGFAEKVLTFDDVGAKANAHILLAGLDSISSEHDSAIAHVDTALRLQPHRPPPPMAGAIKVWSGQQAQAVDLLKQSMLAEPYYPHWALLELAVAQMVLKRNDEAKEIAICILASETDYILAHRGSLGLLVAISVWEGDPASARQYLERLLKIQPNFSLALVKFQLRARKVPEGPAYNGVASYIDALREAGVPENPPEQ